MALSMVQRGQGAGTHIRTGHPLRKALDHDEDRTVGHRSRTSCKPSSQRPASGKDRAPTARRMIIHPRSRRALSKKMGTAHDKRTADLDGLIGHTIAMPVDTTFIGDRSHALMAMPDQLACAHPPCSLRAGRARCFTPWRWVGETRRRWSGCAGFPPTAVPSLQLLGPCPSTRPGSSSASPSSARSRVRSGLCLQG